MRGFCKEKVLGFQCSDIFYPGESRSKCGLNSFKTMVKLSSLNGWQRLWLVGSLISFLYFVGFRPLEESEKQRAVLNELYSDARGDFASPNCSQYQTAPFLILAEPKGQEFKPGSCSHIWRKRKDASNVDAPYTEADFLRSFENSLSHHYRAYLTMGLISAVAFSFFSYFVGWVFSWILKGFKKN